MILPGDFMWLTYNYVTYTMHGPNGALETDTFMRADGPFLIVQVARERVDGRTEAEALVLAASGRVGWVPHQYLSKEHKRKRRAKGRKRVRVTTWK